MRKGEKEGRRKGMKGGRERRREGWREGERYRWTVTSIIKLINRKDRCMEAAP